MDCAIKYICGGTCRARAYYGGKDIQATTDFCQYEKEAYFDGMIDIFSQNCLL